MSTYREDALNDARDFVAEHLKEDIIDNLMRVYETPNTLYNYAGKDEHTYRYSDTEYQPKEAVRLLEDLDDFEDSLGENGNWRDILSSTAAYTYRNAVVHFINEVLEEINGIDLDNIIDEVVEEIKKQNAEEFKTIEGEDEADYVKSAFGEEYDEYMREEIESQINGILRREKYDN